MPARAFSLACLVAYCAVLSNVAALPTSLTSNTTPLVVVPVDMDYFLGPGSTVVSSETIDGAPITVSVVHNDPTNSTSALVARSGPSSTYCDLNPCDTSHCPTTTSNVWRQTGSSVIHGFAHRISDNVCPPGSITNSYAVSITKTVSVTGGLNLNLPSDFFDKLTFSVGFSYSWGTVKTVGYTADCSDGTNHPCVAIFTPLIGIITGTVTRTTQAWLGDSYQTCSTNTQDTAVHVPITSVSGSSTAAGAYDHCFLDGPQVYSICPRSSFGAIPSRLCPSDMQ